MSYRKQLINHYEKVWNNSGSIYLWDKGPFEYLPSDFRVLEFPPNSDRDMWTYATCCMSAELDKYPVELHLFSVTKDENLIELLTSVAYYHRHTSAIGLNHTVFFGKPWQESSTCDYGFISLPYLDGPELENMILQQERVVKCYWLIPVTKKEVEYKILNGANALEEQFEANPINYLDVTRKSVV